VTLEGFVQVILDRGKAEIDELRAQAHAERERLLAETRAEGAKALEEAEQRAHEAAARKRTQDLARAELEARRIVLTAQREALDQVYEEALRRLASLEENPDLLRTLLKENESEWATGGKVYCAARDEALVRKIVGKAFAGTIDGAGGVIIESGDGTRRIDLRYESILRDVWDDAVKQIAETLWPPGT
jgi:vacuolar-type H+-ATPase subunit E/Vma4